jgi:large subunit ribosomal protein L25
MDAVEVRCTVRPGSGKGSARQTRFGGKTPGVLYGGGEPTLAISLETKSFEYLVRKHGSSAFVLDLKLDGHEDRDLKAIIKELQRDPVTSRIIHVDLQHISMTQLIEVHVPVHLIGTPAGVKEGGILEQLLREIEVSCRASQIPEHVDFEVSHLQKGNSVHVRDLVLPEEIKVITPADRVVATIVVKAAEVTPTAVAAEAPVEGAAEEKDKEKEKGEEKPEKASGKS